MATLRGLPAGVRTVSAVDAAFHVAVYAGFALFALLVFYPFWFVLINSLNGMLDYGVSLYLPRRWSLVNFEFAFREPLLRNSLMVSILRVAVGVTVMVVVNATCAFALRKRTLKLRKIYLAIFTIPLFFGGGLIPQFLNLKRFGLLDTFAVYILPEAWSFFFLVILMSAFNDIDDSIEESARLDGARSLLICLRIYMPMSAPIIAAIALFAGVHHWGVWFDAMYFVRSRGAAHLRGVPHQDGAAGDPERGAAGSAVRVPRPDERAGGPVRVDRHRDGPRSGRLSAHPAVLRQGHTDRRHQVTDPRLKARARRTAGQAVTANRSAARMKKRTRTVRPASSAPLLPCQSSSIASESCGDRSRHRWRS